MDFLIDNLALFMILALALLLFSGYPVALVLIGVGLSFALIGHALGEFPLIAFFNIPLRIYSTLAENLIYPAVPMLLFMGIALERSGSRARTVAVPAGAVASACPPARPSR